MTISSQVGFANTILVVAVGVVGVATGAYLETILTLSGIFCCILIEIIIDIVAVLQELEQ